MDRTYQTFCRIIGSFFPLTYASMITDFLPMTQISLTIGRSNIEMLELVD